MKKYTYEQLLAAINACYDVKSYQHAIQADMQRLYHNRSNIIKAVLLDWYYSYADYKAIKETADKLKLPIMLDESMFMLLRYKKKRKKA